MATHAQLRIIDPLEITLLSADSFKKAYDSHETWQAVKGLEALATAGFELPMDCLSENFRPLSTLSVVVQLSGHVMPGFNNVQYHVREAGFAGRDRVAKNLDFFPKAPAQQPNYFRLTKQSSPIGRLLTQLGVNHGGEKKYGINLPPHILQLGIAYASGKTAYPTRAQALLYDAVAAILFTSLAQYPELKSRILRLPTQISMASALGLATQTCYVFQSAFPGEEFNFHLRIRQSKDHKLPKGTMLYFPVIRFSRATYDQMAPVLGK